MKRIINYKKNAIRDIYVTLFGPSGKYTSKSEKHKNCAIAMFAQFRHVSDHGQRNVRNFISSLYETVS